MKNRPLYTDMLIFLTLIVMLLGGFGILNVLTLRQLTLEVSASNQQIVDYCSQKIGIRLKLLEEYILLYIGNDDNMKALREKQVVKNQFMVAQDLIDSSVNNGDVDGFFVYMPDIDYLSIKRTQTWKPLDALELRTWIKVNCSHKEQGGIWQTAAIGDQEYLLYFRSYKQQLMGCFVSLNQMKQWVEMDTLTVFSKVDLTAAENFERMIQSTDEKGEQLKIYNGQNDTDYILVDARIPDTPVVVYGLLEREKIEGRLTIWQVASIAALTLFSLLSLLLMYYRFRTILKPLLELDRAMNRFADGENEHTEIHTKTYREIRSIYQTFDHMKEQIGIMQKRILQEEGERHRIKQKYLLLQLNPHLLLNSLNLIYSLALVGDLEKIKRIVLLLTRHSRYVLQTEKDFVSLNAELGYVRNYLEIQSIRYPYKFDCDIQRDEELDDWNVPPFIIYTFAENAFKYGLTEQDEMNLCIELKTEEEGLMIRISDSGPGYPASVLKALEEGSDIVDEASVEHYGLKNLKERMYLLYGENSRIRFENSASGGACTTIMIPK